MLFLSLGACAQVTGVVIDSKTRQPIDFANVYYDGTTTGVTTDAKGRFSIKERDDWKVLTVSGLGYVTQKVRLIAGKNKNLKILLVSAPRQIEEVTIQGRRTRYSRRDNPAVELMRKVIDHKKSYDLRQKDFFNYTKYEKMVFSLNEFTEKVFEENEMKRFAFLKDHVERCPETGKLILPLTVDESISELFYRKSPHTEKCMIKAQSSKGVNELVNTGDILTSVLKDVFTDVDIYENECRLLQHPFKSPIANSAISFYRYYIEDTLMIDADEVIQVEFGPNNPQDFGFSGTLFILADSSYQVRKVELHIPSRSDVNFVENMVISQDFAELPTGERVVVSNDMLVELKLASFLKKLQVQRVIRNKNYSFDEISEKVFKRIKGSVYKEPDAEMQTDDYWNEYREVELTRSESQMDTFLDRLQKVKGFKYLIFGFKALVENFVETGDSTHNYVDIGPVNTIITNNHYDKWRFRVSALTNANLSPHLFVSGYVAYGTKTHHVYGKAQLTYSFNKKAYLPREFPMNNLSITYLNDVVSPFDKFIPTDKDNMFLALKAVSVDQFNHTNEVKIAYDREYLNGLKFNASFTHTRNRPVDALFYQPLDDAGAPVNDPAKWKHSMTTAEAKAAISFEPGAAYINTKQRRIKLNKEAPIITVSHTMGFNKLLGGEYEYNVTEGTIYKRVWIPNSFGKMDILLQGGIQWNKVPFPLLIHPAANQSYILEDNTFSLIGNLEFLNDRYLSLMYSWDLSGKLFNRIPLLRKLKWREMVGLNVLWGTLTDKNNPMKTNDKSGLFYFPGHFQPDGSYECNTVVMDPKTPYVELRLAIHNILKIVHVEYVRRLTYLSNPNIRKWGIRLKVRMTF